MLLPRYHYPSDTSDLEWALLKALLPTPACQTPKSGAPEKWPRRRIVDAIRYITDNGAKWRAARRLRHPPAHSRRSSISSADDYGCAADAVPGRSG
ncbi:transposase [Streptomyces sp. NPDC059909]|uniref:transposase n=1 Tax=Streptomyces sp. NPDC059909 TaxID=3346998 RepID=UPI00365ACAE2